MKDVQRGHVIDDDIESWTPHKVGDWLRSKGETLASYANSFEDEGINGHRLMLLKEGTLKRKLGVQSLGHRKEISSQIQALMKGRKNWLKL
mmetsp:Transcript_41650/g.65005  ORF Transcript_41650/g.65005 Transcript_41650/m.65005 type:complete len:91 (+) Transcript_41650:192-464(+)